jgi:hypothetical protein
LTKTPSSPTTLSRAHLAATLAARTSSRKRRTRSSSACRLASANRTARPRRPCRSRTSSTDFTRHSRRRPALDAAQPGHSPPTPRSPARSSFGPGTPRSPARSTFAATGTPRSPARSTFADSPQFPERPTFSRRSSLAPPLRNLTRGQHLRRPSGPQFPTTLLITPAASERSRKLSSGEHGPQPAAARRPTAHSPRV